MAKIWSALRLLQRCKTRFRPRSVALDAEKDGTTAMTDILFREPGTTLDAMLLCSGCRRVRGTVISRHLKLSICMIRMIYIMHDEVI